MQPVPRMVLRLLAPDCNLLRIIRAQARPWCLRRSMAVAEAVAVEDMAVGGGAERVAVEAPGREAEVGMVAPAGPLAPAVDTVGRAAARAPGIRAAVTTATRTT